MSRQVENLSTHIYVNFFEKIDRFVSAKFSRSDRYDGRSSSQLGITHNIKFLIKKGIKSSEIGMYIFKIEAISRTIMRRSAQITSSIRSAFSAIIDILRRQGCGSFSTCCRLSLKPYFIYKCLYLTTFSCRTVLFPSLCNFRENILLRPW